MSYREWYTSDALLLNSSLSSDLIGKLYDLNELEFHLSCMGCDLDMSWPSFGRYVYQFFKAALFYCQKSLLTAHSLSEHLQMDMIEKRGGTVVEALLAQQIFL